MDVGACSKVYVWNKYSLLIIPMENILVVEFGVIGKLLFWQTS